MGFSIYYRSVLPVDADQRTAAVSLCNDHCHGRSWLSCEPVHFFPAGADNHLFGGSKPNFAPHPDDAASAAAGGLPDGNVQDVIDVLCKISIESGIDWEISHDHSEGPVGFIRAGATDPEVITQIEALSSIGDIFGEFGFGSEYGAEFGDNPGGETGDEPGDDPGGLRLFDPESE